MIARFFGKILHGVKCGEEKCIYNLVPPNENENTITFSSNDFENDGYMPQKCAGEGVGDDKSPHLKWSNLPQGTKEIVLACEDIDVPIWVPILHSSAILKNTEISEIPEAALNTGDKSSGSIEGLVIGCSNFRNHFGYAGPRPLPSHGPHRYVFEIYALSESTGINKEKYTKDQLVNAMKGKVIGRGRLTGLYVQE